jgi:Leucine-rich repeat (LRR) protein
MKQLLLICAVVMGQSVLAADKKPLTKEESAKVIDIAIRKELKKLTHPRFNPKTRRVEWEKLTKKDYEKVRLLHLGGTKLTDVTGLEKLTNVQQLALSGCKLTDVTCLEKLTKLKTLSLDDNQLAKLPKGLEKLTQLTYLMIHENQLTDLKGLEKLSKLRNLHLAPGNGAITKSQIQKLQKALPKCFINMKPKK